MLIYYKGNNSKMGENLDKKTIRVIYFFIRNPYMKFQNISIHGSNNMHMKATNSKHCKESYKISLNWLKI